MTETLTEKIAREIAEECDPDIEWHEYAASEQQGFRRRAVRILALAQSAWNTRTPIGGSHD